MKRIQAFLIFTVICGNVYCEEEKDDYGMKYEDFSLEVLMTNERLLKNHFECIFDNKGCTPEAADFKKHIPEIMETCCSRCSPKRLEQAKKFTQFLIDNKPEILKKVFAKYDPDKIYRKKCSGDIEKGGVDLTKY
ncbi:hypothetical protein HHI36_011798 [Cryptolaemus montrouzieri]|uniref:Chemosensory protein n=1 Tax=Cryptolaemus montrouzieri TaxID=559131 RepID=A0ABD2NCY5_9CUCU